ncbi:hypothetical protein [Flexithrix dorotheae]|uniref:hypothetical protein n=1 Tax=Flexithrix dorotheae TaxID=70993 RepID=UPI00037A8E3A|nr:hypothetical protein [Flexithrix dorotheae]
MKTAIVYIDLSKRSKTILEFVMHLRRFIPLDVHLVYNINDYAIQPFQTAEMYPGEPIESIVLDDRNQIKQKVNKFIEESSCWGKTQLKENLEIETGPLFETIQNLAYRQETFVIVPEVDESVAFKKLNKFENFDILEEVRIPTLIVPNNFHFQLFQSIIFVTNFNNKDIEALEFINKLALPINARIHIIHVTEKKNDLVQGRLRQLKDKVSYLMEESAINFTYEAIVSKHHFQTIQDVAEDRKAGMVVFQEFLLKFMLGKTLSNGTMVTSRLPMLVYNKR